MSEKVAKKNKIFNLVDKAPFAGKFSVKHSYVEYLAAPDVNKNRKALGSTAFLGFMVAAHAFQAKLGVDILETHLPDALEDPNARDIIYSGIGGPYALAMGAVATRQMDLMRKLGVKHYQWLKEHKTIPEADRHVEKRPYNVTKRAVILAFGVTFAGQAAAMVPMIDDRVQQVRDAMKDYQWSSDSTHSYYIDHSSKMYDTNTIQIERTPLESFIQSEPFLQSQK